MNEDSIPGSPCTQHKRRKKSKCGTNRKKSKSDNATAGYDDNNISNTSESQSVTQNSSHDPSATINSINNVNRNSPTSSGPKGWTRRDILLSAFLLEEANHFPVSCSNRTILCDPPTLEFQTVTQQIAIQQPSSVVKLDDKCKLSSNVQSNRVMETQCDITNTQFLRVIDEVENEFHENVSNATKINEGTVDVNCMAMLEDVQVFTTVDQQPKSIVQSILSDFSSPTKSPVDATLRDEQYSPTVIRISTRVKKTYSRIGMAANAICVEAEEQLQEISIPSASASICSGIALESDEEEVTVQQNICVREPSAVNSNDNEVDLNRSIHVVDNIQNLSNFYSQSERPDSNDVNETFKLVMASKCRSYEIFGSTKPSQSLEDQEDFLGFDNTSITSIENFNTIASGSDDSSYICLYSSVWCKNSSIEENSDPPKSPEGKQYLDGLWDDDDLFAYVQTQQPEPIVKEREPVASTSALKQIGHPINENILQEIRSNATNINPINSFGHCAGSVKQNVTYPLATSNLKPQFDNLPSVPDQFQGFRTVRGAPIHISKKETIRVKNMFDDIQLESDTEMNWPNKLSKTNPSNNEVKFNHGGFSSARVHRNPVPMTSNTNRLFDAIKREDEIESDRTKAIYNGPPNKITEKPPECRNSSSGMECNPPYAIFSTARRNRIPVPKPKTANNFFGDIELEYEMGVGQPDRFLNGFPNKSSDVASHSKRQSTEASFNSPCAGFSTARGNRIPVPKPKTTNNLFGDIELEYDMEVGQPDRFVNDFLTKSSDLTSHLETKSMHDRFNSPREAFSTARVNQIPILSAAASKSATIYDDVMMMDQSHLSVDGPVIQLPKCTAANKSSVDHGSKYNHLKNATRSFREVTNSLEYANMESEQRVFPENTSNVKINSMPNSGNVFAKPSPLTYEPMVNGQRKFEVMQSKENIKVLPSSVRVATSEIRIQSPKVSNAFLTPINCSKTWTQEGRESAEVLMQDERSGFLTTADLSEGFQMALVSCSSTPIQTNNNNRHRPRQVRLIERFDDIERDEFNIQNVSIKSEIPENVIAMRKTAFEDQCRRIHNKANVSSLPGALYMKKLISSKLMWKNFVDNSRPLNGVPHPELSRNVLSLTSDNAKEFKFNAWDQFSEEFCRENISGIRLTDDINVMMDGNCQIGLNQIANAFLSCPTVDPKLIHDKWIENNFRWIVIKLAGMERSFPQRFGGEALTLENMMLQFKYRYDREIDHVERSAIRKICEMDDIPAKRMILFVAAIHISDNSVCELELSDGWYSLLSTLDNQMAKLVSNGKIKVGTKLVIQGAELTGLDGGCHPLDVPSNVRLKISTNSTRRARWDTKLGYCKNAGPFLISLKSVFGDGGSISKLRICVLRTYPIVYLDRTNNSCIHSQKVEKRRSMDEEQIYSNLAEKVYSQVCRDYEKEEKTARLCIRSPKAIAKPLNVPEITDPEILYELLEHGNDPESIEYKMTDSQKAMVKKYKTNLNMAKSDEINSRVQEKLASMKDKTRKSTPLFKFKISDENSFDKTAIVSVWNPSEELSAMIHEEAVLEMTSSSVRGIKSDELQIYAGKACIFKRLDVKPFRLPEAYRRRHLSIFDIYTMAPPMFNELDTTGIVVLIGDATTKLQSVYIADHEYNILCINFWGGLKAYAYDDVVLPKRILAAKNLQWRTISSNTSSIRNTFVTEFSIFTTNPKSSEHDDAVTNLKNKFETIDMDEYVKACTKKIFEAKSIKSSTPVRTASIVSVQSPAISLPKTPTDLSITSHHSALSNKSRIDALSKSYPEPLLATPPLHIKSVNRDFQPPSYSK